MRIIGPNCVGVMLPHIGLNATFAKPLALPGNIGFISQSGALCTAILDWSRSIQLGFSAFISIGSMAAVNWGDLIDHLGDDPHTRICLHGVGATRARFPLLRVKSRSRNQLSRLSVGCPSCAKRRRRHTWCAHRQRTMYSMLLFGVSAFCAWTQSKNCLASPSC
jgi:acetyltransferase